MNAIFDFVADGRLFMRVKYKTYRYVPSRADGTAVNCNSTIVKQLIARSKNNNNNNDKKEKLSLNIDDEFWKDGALWHICGINRSSTLCLITNKNGTEECIEQEHAVALVAEYLK